MLCNSGVWGLIRERVLVKKKWNDWRDGWRRKNKVWGKEEEEVVGGGKGRKKKQKRQKNREKE